MERDAFITFHGAESTSSQLPLKPSRLVQLICLFRREMARTWRGLTS